MIEAETNILYRGLLKRYIEHVALGLGSTNIGPEKFDSGSKITEEDMTVLELLLDEIYLDTTGVPRHD